MKQRRARTTLALDSLLILALAAAAGCTTVTNASGRIELSATEFDFGTIPNTGPVSQTFQVRNGGQGWLEITGVSTSCGCTTAEVDSRRLAPGEATDLRVSFDPQTHDGATGAFLRQVYVRSNDPDTPEASLTIRATVVEPGKRPSQSQVYRPLFQTYGVGAFFDQALAAQLQADLLAELPAERPVLVVEPAEMDLGTVPV